MSDTWMKLILALVPFVALFSGFLVFHWGSLKTVTVTCIIEFIVILTYYHTSATQGAQAALWGSVAVWPTIYVTFTAQIFGYIYRQTGLMRVMLDSIGSLFPKNDVDGHALTLLSPISGIFANFEGRAAYAVIIPGLAELGYDPVRACTAALMFMSWIMPFASFMLNGIIANMATHVPITTIVTAVGPFSIVQVFVCVFATFQILGLKFFTRSSQMLYWVTVLPFAFGVFLCTEVWPQYYALTLFVGAALNIICLYLYGRARKRQAGPNMVFTPQGVGAASVAPAPETGMHWSLVLKGWGPLIVGFVYAAFMLSPQGGHILHHVAFQMSAWGFKPIEVNLLNTPGTPILVGALSSYLFRTQRTNPIKDIAVGLRRGVSPMLTAVIGIAVMYLLIFTKQVDFLGMLLGHAGKTVFMLLDALIIFAGGTIFGSGSPAIFTFSTMQMPVATAFGVSLVLLLGVVVGGTSGITNACKPPNIRFCTALLGLKAEHDSEVFRMALRWALVQVVVFTVMIFILLPFWGGK